MAAFSYQHHPFLLDSLLLPNITTPFKLSGFMEEGSINTNINDNTDCFSQFYSHDPFKELPVGAILHEGSCLEQNSKGNLSDNEPSVTRKQSTESSTAVDSSQVTQNVTSMAKKRKNRNESVLNSARSRDAGEGKSKKQKKCNGEEGKVPKAGKKEKKKVPEEPPTGYIHVRARRGQATDSHSLAERVRREKISERMKILQRLVPGCDKVTGKALVLDEIINYVQSLQSQVEFLSMKLASVNPVLYDFGVDLDVFMIRPERLSDNMASALPSVQQQCSPTQSTGFADATTATFAPANNYPLLDGSASASATASVLLQPGQLRPDDFPQGNGSLMWDVNEQRQKFLNPSGYSTNLYSFH